MVCRISSINGMIKNLQRQLNTCHLYLYYLGPFIMEFMDEILHKLHGKTMYIHVRDMAYDIIFIWIFRLYGLYKFACTIAISM